jgi:hypothetical protein
VLTDADADAFDATVGSWLMSSLPGPAAEEDRIAEIRFRLVAERIAGNRGRSGLANGRRLRRVRSGDGRQSQVAAHSA